MNFVRHEPKNLKKTIRFTKSLHPTITRGITLGLNETGNKMVKHTRQKMSSGPFTGKTYRIRGRLHRASAGGEYPHTITGKLSRSINKKTFGASRLEFGSTVDYAKFLEDGTSKMQARNFLLQTAKAFDKQIEVDIIKRVNIEIRKQGIKIK